MSDLSDDEDSCDHNSIDQRLFPWERWENTIRELTFIPAIASISTIDGKTFRMPLMSSSEFSQQHRDILGFRLCPDNLCVARPVGKHEIERTPAAKLAMKKELDRLRSKHVWDEDHPRDWDEVRFDARRGGYTVHMGYLFGICVEKNAELDPSLRKFKGRVVFQGNQVYDQDHNYAIFQDLGS
ncbi:MAG: hypothetical protein ACKPKO_08655, partial [Candidatus Fonsibacter sp.]